MRQLAVAAPFRDETRYLREWLEYHRLVAGAGLAILVNTHPAGDPEGDAASAVLAPYARAGYVIELRLADVDIAAPDWQLRAWRLILACAGRAADWVLLTDLDCFLFAPGGDWIPAVLDRYDTPYVGGLAVYTCTFGSSERACPPLLQTRDLVRRAPLDAPCNWTANYLVRPARLAGDPAIYQLPAGGRVIVDTAGETVPLGAGRTKRPGPLDVLRLNHYSVRSDQDWLAKCRRGWPGAPWADPNHTLADHKRAMLDRNDEADYGMLRYAGLLEVAVWGEVEL